MYGQGLKVQVARRDEIDGEPVDRLEIDLDDGSKNVIVVLKVDPDKATQEVIERAAEWLGERCGQMSGNTIKYHGVVIVDDQGFDFDLVEVERNSDDEVTRP